MPVRCWGRKPNSSSSALLVVSHRSGVGCPGIRARLISAALERKVAVADLGRSVPAGVIRWRDARCPSTGILARGQILGEHLAIRRELSERTLAQRPEHFLQPLRKLFIHIRNLMNQSLNHDPKGAREFVDVELSDERVLELRGYFARQHVDATTVDRRKAVANAGQCERVVANTANHVFRLP